MKRLFLLLLLTSNVFAQNDFIITNNGEKIDAVDTSIIINAIEKNIEFKTLERSKTKTIDFNDFSYCYFEGYVFMTFDLYKNNDIKGYFVIADSKNRKLISATLPPINEVYNKFSNQIVRYESFVLDENLSVLEKFTFDNIKIESNALVRSQISPTLTPQFKGFPEFLDRLAILENKPDEFNLKIIELFEYPSYMKKVEKK